jgi:hypothetical protein
MVSVWWCWVLACLCTSVPQTVQHVRISSSKQARKIGDMRCSLQRRIRAEHVVLRWDPVGQEQTFPMATQSSEESTMMEIAAPEGLLKGTYTSLRKHGDLCPERCVGQREHSKGTSKPHTTSAQSVLMDFRVAQEATSGSFKVHDHIHPPTSQANPWRPNRDCPSFDFACSEGPTVSR